MSRIGERLMVHPTSATNIVQRPAASGLSSDCRTPPTVGDLARSPLSGVAAMEAGPLPSTRLISTDAHVRPGRDLTSLLRHVRVAAGDFRTSLRPLPEAQ